METQQTKMKCYYLGKTYPLDVKIDPSTRKVIIEFDGKKFLCTSPQEGEIDLSIALQSFYIKTSRKLIEERLKLYQSQFKVKYKSYSIENDSSKWGSCSSKRHLTFNWKLIMFPIEAIDYVVIHELCHLIHLNHDRSFWRLVGKVCPNYKEAMAILGTEKTRDM
ncbi:hypothetical protein EDC18_102266 [Natranaerovirga pectinivora]|uniref:YgjP-like metallopeptidase domain-containing protein n=1 Tax=Natranaerovirga pectinivora TaxID=682400 RepID=A0A4R3MMP7_9FIRM|nr:SprT family zinc-dependent metalloprotease [Natranaerovirga pectinivora]TCT16249.1 hypothetical protein EDC18_102266 [Natranaerovirga pectinivora]